METFDNINDVLYSVNADVVRRKKNPILPILITLGGAVLTVWSLSATALQESENLSSALMFAGIVLVLAGAIMAVRAFTSAIPYYRPTGERLYRSERFFQQKDKRGLCAALESGNAEELANLPQSDTSGVVLTIYSTRSGSFTLVQAAEYVPHRFVPVTPVVSFTQEQARIVLALT